MNLRNAYLLAAGSVAAALVMGTPAQADDNKLEWSATLGATSDYIFRGISLNEEDPAFQPSINVSYGILYAGVWGSNVKGVGYAPWETDIYAGIKPELGPVTFDFGVVWYIYPGNDFGGSLGLDYVEFKAGASTSPVTNLTLTSVLWYTPDQGSHYPETWTTESSVAYTLPAVGIFTPTISGLYGFSQDENDSGYFLGESEYTYWNAGVALAVENITFDLRYWDTDIDAPTSDERFVFSASVTVP